MAVDHAQANEDTVRRRMRRQQFANTFVIMLFALGIVALSAYSIGRWHPWREHAPRIPEKPRPTPAAPGPAPAIAAAPPRTVPAIAPAAVTEVSRPKPKLPAPTHARDAAPKPGAAPPAPQPQAPPEPTAVLAPPSTAQSLSNYSSGPGAKRMLNDIKCFDDFAFEHEAHGRQYFSALCKGGNRMVVSCIGGGCRIEYAPPPSHVP